MRTPPCQPASVCIAATLGAAHVLGGAIGGDGIPDECECSAAPWMIGPVSANVQALLGA
jgi:hypothetical protein